MKSIGVKKFDMNVIADSGGSPNIMIVGRRESGKSFLVKDILARTRERFSGGNVISYTEMRGAPFFQNFMPREFIRDECTPAVIAEITASKVGSGVPDPSFVVFDDCLTDEICQTPQFRTIFMNDRHLKITNIIATQTLLSMGPALRTCIGFVFILREKDTEWRRRIYEQFGYLFDTFEMFCKFMDLTSESYDCLVIDNTSKSKKIEDRVFWYKASDHPLLQMRAPSE